MPEILEIRAVERVARRMLDISGSGPSGDGRPGGCWRSRDPEIRTVERVARRMLEISGSGDPGHRETGPEDAGDLGIWAVERLARRMLEILGSGDLGRRESGLEMLEISGSGLLRD
ncbi:hypothetical protein CTA1_3142 [Colletotrichum tanaceti]|uniref:Uncharacterized protein n=1 Tax=Colletotrichum tanaceti TaxID=1306861 RepID=A0A4U6XVL6_9PEZI|nr:hypothetical protein CTA1_3142 [Colletotrichum tanaceti]